MREWTKVLGLAAFSVLLAAFLMVGCGGGEEEEGAPEAPAAAEEATPVTEEGTPVPDEGVMPPRDLLARDAIQVVDVAAHVLEGDVLVVTGRLVNGTDWAWKWVEVSAHFFDSQGNVLPVTESVYFTVVPPALEPQGTAWASSILERPEGFARVDLSVQGGDAFPREWLGERHEQLSVEDVEIDCSGYACQLGCLFRNAGDKTATGIDAYLMYYDAQDTVLAVEEISAPWYLTPGESRKQTTYVYGAEVFGPALARYEAVITGTLPSEGTPVEKVFKISDVTTDEYTLEDGRTIVGVTGKIKNVSDKTWNSVELHGLFVDAAGNVVDGVDLEPAPDILAPGDEAPFGTGWEETAAYDRLEVAVPEFAEVMAYEEESPPYKDLEVTEVEMEDGAITGVVTNSGAEAAEDVRVFVYLYDKDNRPIAWFDISPEDSELAPGESSTFEESVDWEAYGTLVAGHKATAIGVAAE